jgi:hypothetical protein
MFISTKVLTKLIKDQYKVRLRVGYLKGGIIIVGNEWSVWIDYEYVSNKIKGLIVELAGGLPDKNKIFSLCKSNPDPQYEIITPETDTLFDDIENANNALSISHITLKNSIRLLQTQDPLLNIVEVKEKLLDLIDLSELDYDIEGEPTGPCYAGDPYSKMFWYNDIAKLLIMPYGKRDNPLFSILSEVAFDEKLLIKKE